MLKKINLFVFLFIFNFIYSFQKNLEPYLRSDLKTDLEFVILVTSYNNEKYFFRNLESICYQQTKYKYDIIYINDCSTDKTGELVDTYVKENNLESKVKVIHNTKRVGALENIYNAVHSCPNNKIIITVDGDDFLIHDKVIERVAKEYEDKNTWMTYVQFLFYPDCTKGFCHEIPESILKKERSFRNHYWFTTHLRTFYAGLFKKIRKEDLVHENKFYQYAQDLAWVYPMAEMSLNGHIKFIPDILYGYNNNNSICDHNINKYEQKYFTNIISSKPKYNQIETLEI